MQTLLIIIGSLAAVLLLFWVLATGLRIFYSPDMSSAAGNRRRPEKRKLLAGTRVVRFEDIRIGDGLPVATLPEEGDYLYEKGYSAGWPDEWTEDLFLRRN